jgi:ribosomal-protein-alanine N-acetyltransferase
VGERVQLRLGRAEDAPRVLAYFQENLEHLRASMPKPSPKFLTVEHWHEQIERNAEEFRGDRSIRLFVFDGKDVVGTVNATQLVRHPFHCATLGYGVARGREGRGLAGEAVRLAIDHLFRVENFHRLQANYRPTNARSGRLLRRLGFLVEGYARDYLQLDGAWEDHVLASLTNPAWKPQ